MKMRSAGLAAGLALSSVVASSCSLDNALDVFGELQQNAWYLPTEDGQARLYVTELGEGPPVVFLHGGPGNNFYYIVDALRPHTKEATFILFDQRGSLMSPIPDADVPALTAEVIVNDLETLREAIGQKQLVLFGHSWGSLIALKYFEGHPENVAGLILAAAFPPKTERGVAGLGEEMRVRQGQLLDRDEEIGQVLRAAGLPEDASEDTPRQSTMRWRIQSQAPITIMDLSRWREATAAGSAVYYNHHVGMAVSGSLPDTLDFSDVITTHPVPIAVVQGDHDYLGPGAPQWQELSRDCPQIKVTVLTRSNHNAWIDAPDGFREALSEAIRFTQFVDRTDEGSVTGCQR